MTEDKLVALRRMVKERTNIEESRNALLQLLKRNAIEPQDVMEFVEAYQAHKTLKQPAALPDSLTFFVGVNYEGIRNSMSMGYNYCPMIKVNDSPSTMDDEIFEVTVSLKGREKAVAKAVTR